MDAFMFVLFGLGVCGAWLLIVKDAVERSDDDSN